MRKIKEHLRSLDDNEKAAQIGKTLGNGLNAVHFACGVGKAAETVGSCLYLDRDCCRVRPEYVTDRSIVINPPEPAERMTEDDRNTPWV